MPEIRRLAAWTTPVAFVAGLVGPDAVGVAFIAVATFVLAFGSGRTPWRWALVSLTAWATGAGIGTLLTVLEHVPDLAAPSQAGAGAAVLTAYASAFAGWWLGWVTSRMARQE